MDRKESIINGVNKAVDIIKSTMGYNGKLVGFLKDGKLLFTKDGVTVAKQIQLEDEIENIGCQIVVSATNETVTKVGDGTSLTSVLVQAFLKTFQTYGVLYDTNTLINKIESFIKDLIPILEEKSIKVTDLKQIKNIATISANSESLGNLITEIYEQIGFDSLVSLEKSNDYKTTYEIVKGLQFDTGLVHSEFKNNDTNCTLINPYILIEEEACTTFNKFEKIFSTLIALTI